MIFEIVQPAFPYLKYAVPGVAIVLVILYAIAGRWRIPFVQGILAAVLLCAAIFASFDWVSTSWTNKDLINSYEFFHYYLPTKYAEELGYTKLYGATIVAEKELNHRFIASYVRDLKTGRTVSTQTILQQSQKYKEGFSEERWEEYKKDVHFFRTDFKSNQGWQKMLGDKGYNGTPVWTMVGGTLANSFSTDSTSNINVLALIDWFYFFAAMLCVAWAFGPRTALLLACLLLTHYVAFHGTLKAAYMRLDWVMCLIMSVCFVKKNCYGIAGTLTAFAALSRVFPAVFIFGIVAHAVWGVFQNRSLEKKYIRFFVSFGVTCVVMLAASLAYTGIEYWKDFIEKITAHSDDISAWRVGLKYLFLMSHDMPGPGELSFMQRLEEYGWVYRGLQLALLGFTFLLTRRIQTWQAYTFGFIASFILVAPTYYYYIMLGVPFLFFAAELERPLYALGAIHMYIISILGHYWLSIWNRGYQMFFWYSVIIGLAILLMWALASWEWIRFGMQTPTTEENPEEKKSETPKIQKRKTKKKKAH